jgi:hypothetical protein
MRRPRARSKVGGFAEEIETRLFGDFQEATAFSEMNAVRDVVVMNITH